VGENKQPNKDPLPFSSKDLFYFTVYLFLFLCLIYLVFTFPIYPMFHPLPPAQPFFSFKSRLDMGEKELGGGRGNIAKDRKVIPDPIDDRKFQE